jgi:hypothetical protein
MLKDFSWRNLAMFLMALVVTSLLILGSVILAVDRLLYANADRADEQPAVQRPATFHNLGRHVSLAEGCRLFRRTNSRLPHLKGQAA